MTDPRIIPPTKCCKKCGVEYPLTDEYFYVDKRRNKLFSRCKTCYNAHYKEARPNNRPVEDASIIKRCFSCGSNHPATTAYFHSDRSRADGLSYRCKECTSRRARKYCATNSEKVKASKRAYRMNNRDTIIRSGRRYYSENRDKLLYKSAEHRKAHPEWYSEYRKRYEKENIARIRDLSRVRSHRRRAKLLRADGTHDATDIRKRIALQTDKRRKLRCHWCDCHITGTFHADHVIPLARGGSNGPENICISCPTCNLSKGSRLPSEWTDRLF